MIVGGLGCFRRHVSYINVCGKESVSVWARACEGGCLQEGGASCWRTWLLSPSRLRMALAQGTREGERERTRACVRAGAARCCGIVKGVRSRRCDARECCVARNPLAVCCAVRCSVLQCVAVRCSVLQCVAVCCSVLQCVAVCCSALHCVAVRCIVLQWRIASKALACGKSLARALSKPLLNSLLLTLTHANTRKKKECQYTRKI